MLGERGRGRALARLHQLPCTVGGAQDVLGSLGLLMYVPGLKIDWGRGVCCRDSPNLATVVSLLAKEVEYPFSVSTEKETRSGYGS